MPYIDADYYKNTFKGEYPEDEPTLLKLIDRASDKIDELCFLLVSTELTDYHQNIQDLVKKATAYQTEFYVLNGGNEKQGVEQVSVGSFSYSGGKSKEKDDTSLTTIKLLNRSGLMYSGVS